MTSPPFTCSARRRLYRLAGGGRAVVQLHKYSIPCRLASQSMRTQGRALLAALALIVLVTPCACTAEVGFAIIDNAQSQYALPDVHGQQALTPDGASCIKASLLGIPCRSGGAAASAQVPTHIQGKLLKYAAAEPAAEVTALCACRLTLP